MTPEACIKDAVIKDLIRIFINVQREDYIYLGDTYPTIKKSLKSFFKAMESVFEIMD